MRAARFDSGCPRKSAAPHSVTNTPASERGQIVCRLEEAADKVRAYIAALGSDD